MASKLCFGIRSSRRADATKSDVIDSIIHKDTAEVDGKYEDVDLDKLTEHIALLLKLIEEKKSPHQSRFTWPSVPGLKKLKEILSLGTDLKKLEELLSSGLKLVSAVKDIISGPVKDIVKGIGHASIATAGLLVVAYSLERYDELSSNKEECLKLLKEMCYVADLVKSFKESPKGLQNVIEDATALIVGGAIMCCAQIDSSPLKRFLIASKNKDELSSVTKNLDRMYLKINVQIGFRVLTAIELKGKSPLSKGYPSHAVGIDKSITEVLDLLECESEENAVTVILLGYGGMGKSTLADAVFSLQTVECKYSKVRLSKDINSSPSIIKLQKEILKDLMGPEETIPVIRTYEDGQRELERVLTEVEAFIYIDNVLERNALKELLPLDIDAAKKVTLLLTAREENVKFGCPRSRRDPKIYNMKGIQPPEARLILKREIKEGINGSQFNDIIEMCGEIPLMLTLAAPFIGRAENKREAYSALMRQRGKWEIEDFKPMRYAFAYDALPDKCKDTFLDICSYFKRWDWDRVEDIVGKDELETLQRRALVFKDANGLTSVHDVILTLACQKSLDKSEGKEVRRTFATSSELKQFFDEKKNTEDIKGIWFSDDTDAPFHIYASTLDSMSKSLRVLHLGNLTTTVEGNCSQTFAQLIFFRAKITRLPFDVSKFTQLRYLAYKPKDLKLYEMPSGLRHMEFDGTLHSQAFQISSTDLQRLGNLRVLRLIKFEELINLDEKFGDLVNGLQELSLSYCKSLDNLPKSISKLQSLQKLKIDHCSSLVELPADFGSLISLRELDLKCCQHLQRLPDSFEKLASLTLLNLSFCRNLLNLPFGLGNLTGLVELDLKGCIKLESIPESIGELKLLTTLGMSHCWNLKELPHEFCNLSFITHLSMKNCSNLKKLPDRFDQLANLRVLDFLECWKLEKLPEGFGQLKCLAELVLKKCYNLKELCNDFHCLSSLQNLDLSNCNSLDKLPEDFHSLASLQQLYICSCNQLEGKWMDHVVKMNRLQTVHIEGSEQLVKRWADIRMEGDQSWSFTVISGQDLPMSEGQKEDVEKKLLSEFDCLLTDGRGEPFHLSDLPPGTLILVICDAYPYNFKTNRFPWRLIRETIDEMQIEFKVIYIGPHFYKLPTKVRDIIFVGHQPKARAREVLKKVCLTLDANTFEAENDEVYSFQMRTKVVGDDKSDKYRPCWTLLTDSELEKFLLSNSTRYLQLKGLVDGSQNSNIELLREMFAPGGDETTHVFQKNYPSKQDGTENSEPFACGVDKLKGKTIIFEMRSADLCYDIRLGFLKKLYVEEKDKLDLEIISIPILEPSTDKNKQFSREVPWLVLQNPWTVMTRAVRFFLAEQCGLEGGNEYEKWYPSINWIIEPNGKITAYEPSVFPMLDRGNVVKVIYNHFKSVSYQVRWGPKACPYMHERIVEFRKEEWKHQKRMSTLEFLFNHLESVSNQVKDLMFKGKLICLYSGDDEKVTCSMLNAMKELGYCFHIIHIGHKNMQRFWLTDTIYKDYYYPSKNTIKMEGVSLLDLSLHETARFWIRLLHLKEEINGMDENDKQLCEMRSLLHSLPLVEEDDGDGSMTFMGEDGKMVATCRGEIMKWIFRDDREDRAKDLLMRMMKELEGGKETYDEESSISSNLTGSIHTAASTVEQENVDVDVDINSLREHTSELLAVEQLYQLLKFNKENKRRSWRKMAWRKLRNFLSEKKWSRPKVRNFLFENKRSRPELTWPTSRGLSMLKSFLSDGMDVNWVHDVISRLPEQEKWKTVTNSLLKRIGEAQWAAAGLLVVADVLQRFETVSTNRNECLFLLDEMFKVAIYLNQIDNRSSEFGTFYMKRAATRWIMIGSIACCAQIDPAKFSKFAEKPMDKEMLSLLQQSLIEKCDIMAKAITEGLGIESWSLVTGMLEGFSFKMNFSDLFDLGEGEDEDEHSSDFDGEG